MVNDAETYCIYLTFNGNYLNINFPINDFHIYVLSKINQTSITCIFLIDQIVNLRTVLIFLCRLNFTFNCISPCIAGMAASHLAIDQDISEIDKRKSCYLKAAANNCESYSIYGMAQFSINFV